MGKRRGKKQFFINPLPQSEMHFAFNQNQQVVRWITHYSSTQEILLVGEGDFSFSLCLARAFGSASNITATSLDSYDDLVRQYRMAGSNLQSLYALGACILHGVDANSMKFHPSLNMRKFDRIIFNFPHAGFYRKESDPYQIGMHMNVVNGFFNNARDMLRYDGEIHINHKTKFPYNCWNLQQLAINNCLAMFQCVEFKIQDYPGYNHKRGTGPRCDEPFHLGSCGTFKFKVDPWYACRMYPQQSNVQVVVQQQPTSIMAPLGNSFEHVMTVFEPNAYFDVNYSGSEDGWSNYDSEVPERFVDQTGYAEVIHF
ncbi:hypothetical protein ACFE04_021942 [Oxalis oulophora]